MSSLCIWGIQFSAVAQSCPTLCDPMNCSMPGLLVHHHLLDHSNSRPSIWWCHPAISSSVISFSSCPQSLPASESFPMSQIFAWGAKVLEFQLQHYSFQRTPRTFRMDWLDLLAVQGTLKSLLQYHSSKASILQHSAFFTVQHSHPYMTTGKP